MAAMGNLFAQHRAVKTTTLPNMGTVLEYGVSDPTADRAMTDEPTILWEKYENGATPDDVFYIEATGDYLVYYGLNDKRLSLFDSQGAVKWEKPISSGGRAAISPDSASMPNAASSESISTCMTSESVRRSSV